MKLKTRLVYFNVGIVFFAAMLCISYLIGKTYMVTNDNNIKRMNLEVEKTANEMERVLGAAQNDARNLAGTIEAMLTEGNTDRELLNKTMKNMLESNIDYTYVWTAWEPNAFDRKDMQNRNKNGSDNKGRFLPMWMRIDGEIFLTECFDIESNEYYKIPKETKEEYIARTINYDENGKEFETISFCVPVLRNNNFLGVVGVDISIDTIMSINNTLDIEFNGYGRIVDNEGITVAHPNITRINTILDDIASEENDNLSKIKNGENFVDSKTKVDGDKTITFYAPIHFEDYNESWSYSIVVKKKSFNEEMFNLLIVLFSIAIIAVAFMMVIVITNGNYVTKAINVIQNSIEKIAGYDLSNNDEKDILKYSNKKDEIGGIAKKTIIMRDNFVELVGKVAENTDKVSESAGGLSSISQESAAISEEISRAMTEISNGAMEQAEQAENGNHGIEELGRLVNQNKEAMINIKNGAQGVNESVDVGMEVVAELINTTEKTDEAINEIANIIHKTNESSEKINLASEIISAIAAKTNLLSLNAAIEAARAGEAGRGFVVVAEEIKGLALQSAESTSEIHEMVKHLQENINIAVDKMLKVSEMAKNQRDSVKLTENKYVQIEEKATEALDAVISMGDFIENMQTEKNNVVDVIQSLATIAQENVSAVQQVTASVEEQTSSAEEMAGTCESLSYMAKELKENVDKFKI